ncbi:MAG: flagellar biosynthetic protein FliR, partial [Calditrichota bacterium]
ALQGDGISRHRRLKSSFPNREQMPWFDIQHLEAVILVFLRISTAIVLMPIFGYQAVPLQIKAGLAFLISLAIGPQVISAEFQAPPGPALAMGMAAGEVSVGLVIGAVTLLLFVGAEFAGAVIGVQMGFGIMSVIDPQTGGQTTIISQLNYWIAMIIFITLDFHLRFLAVIGDSFRLIPLGGFLYPEAAVTPYIKLTGEVFVIAVKLAAPVLAMLLLSDIALGFVARTVPQMNVFIVGFPLKVGLGLFGIAVSLPLLVYVLSKMFGFFEIELETILAAVSHV